MQKMNYERCQLYFAKNYVDMMVHDLPLQALQALQAGLDSATTRVPAARTIHVCRINMFRRVGPGLYFVLSFYHLCRFRVLSCLVFPHSIGHWPPPKLCNLGGGPCLLEF